MNHHAGPSHSGLSGRKEALLLLGPFLRLVWETNRTALVATIALRIVRGVLPLAVLWVGKMILDTVLALRGGAGPAWMLWQYVGLEIVLVISGEVLARTSSLVESLLGDQLSNRTSILLMEHASQLDLAQFEDPVFYDKLERARRQTTNRIGLFVDLLGMGQDAFTLCSLGVALVVFSPWLLLLLAVAVLPGFLGETHYAALEYSLLYRYTPERRQLDYLRYVGASDETAKEVQVYGLASWVINRYRTIARRFYEENRKLSLRKGIVGSLLALLGTAGYYGAYGVILLTAVAGAISIGTLTFLAGSFARNRDLMQRLLLGAGRIYEQCLYLKDLFDFLATQPAIRSPLNPLPVPRPLREGFVFDDVGFRYPGTERWAVRHINLHLRPSTRYALVGENGAGKTTLTKLLARLYDPTEGRILLDGRDLRAYDLREIRNAVAVVFQDFVAFDFRFDENIGVGDVESVRSYLDASLPSRANGDAPPPGQIIAAADKSLASSLLGRLEAGYRQMLGRRFDGGVELSGGEWQKVAIARAYMRDAPIVILDEPTSSLDARAEYDVFKRFAGLVEDRMAVIISHRFSTVRIAEHIIVLRDGRVLEEGSHNDLLEHGGLYAELFALQAMGYR